MTPRIPRACSIALIPVGVKVNVPTGRKKQNNICAQKNKRLIVRGERKKKQRASENFDLFTKSDANRQKQLASKEPPMRDQVHTQKYITLSQRPIEPTLRCGSPLPPRFFRKVTLLRHTLLVGVLATLKNPQQITHLRCCCK